MSAAVYSAPVRLHLSARLAHCASLLHVSFSGSVLAMGVTVRVLRAGDGVTYPRAGQTVVVHYVGRLASNGQQFDSSRDKGRPFEFQLGAGKVIKGWDEGFLQLTVGQRAELTITPDFAYGSRDGERSRQTAGRQQQHSKHNAQLAHRPRALLPRSTVGNGLIPRQPASRAAPSVPSRLPATAVLLY
jgi:FK506-binding protein 1